VPRSPATPLLGVISDTHGLLRPEALAALHGSTLIVHAGDVGSPDILSRLRDIAPTIAVRGNVDDEPWAQRLPMSQTVDFEGYAIHVVHRIDDLDRYPPRGAAHAIIYGHSHKPSIEDRDGVLFLNPGAAGPRRFKLPITIGRVRVVDAALRAEIVEIVETVER
jgi:putative phosphoesterase